MTGTIPSLQTEFSLKQIDAGLKRKQQRQKTRLLARGKINGWTSRISTRSADNKWSRRTNKESSLQNLQESSIGILA